MSTCTSCGAMNMPGAPYCHACGFPVTPIIAVSPPTGTQRAVVGPTPIYQVFSGIFFIIIGLVALSINSFFFPIAAIIILIGVVALALGLMGKSVFSQQIVYETAPAPSNRSVYPEYGTKKCSNCGTSLPPTATLCYKCGTRQ